MLGFFVLFHFFHLVLSESIDDISLKLVLLCNYIIDLLANAIDKRLISIIFGLFFVPFYLLLVESIGFRVMLLVEPVTSDVSLLFAMRLFVELSLEKFLILPFLSLFLFLHSLLSLFLQNLLSLPDDVLRALIDGRLRVLLIEEEGMPVLYFKVGLLTELSIDDFSLLL